jgi:hypothetical protein
MIRRLCPATHDPGQTLTEQGEVVHRDNCDQLDTFSDAALADALVTARAGRLGKLDFRWLVEAFGRLRSRGRQQRRWQ